MILQDFLLIWELLGDALVLIISQDNEGALQKGQVGWIDIYYGSVM